MIKRVLKISLRFLLGFVIFLALYAGSLYVLPLIRFKNQSVLEDGSGITCYLKSNGSHVDIAMPIQHSSFDWSEVISQDKYRASRQCFSMGSLWLGR